MQSRKIPGESSTVRFEKGMTGKKEEEKEDSEVKWGERAERLLFRSKVGEEARCVPQGGPFVSETPEYQYFLLDMVYEIILLHNPYFISIFCHNLLLF